MYWNSEVSFPAEPNLNRNYLRNGKYGIGNNNYRYEYNKNPDSRKMWCGALIYADGRKLLMIILGKIKMQSEFNEFDDDVYTYALFSDDEKVF